MQAVLCAVFATLVLGYVQAIPVLDCSTDVVDYVHCMKDAIEKKNAFLNAKVDAIRICFHEYGCGPYPADEEQGYPEPNLTDAQKECLTDKFEAIGLAKLENCTGKPVPAWVKKAIDTLQAEDKHGDDHKNMSSDPVKRSLAKIPCTNKEIVKRCVQNVIGNDTKISELSTKCARKSFVTFRCPRLIEEFKNDACKCFNKKHRNNSDDNLLTTTTLPSTPLPRHAHHGQGGYGKQHHPGPDGKMIQEVFQQCNITFDFPNGTNNQHQRPPQNSYQRPPTGHDQNQGQNQTHQGGDDNGHKMFMRAHKMKGFRPPLCDCGDDEDDDSCLA